MTQKEMIIDYIKNNDGITAVEAFYNLGISRLSARIKDIRDDGIPITVEWVTSKNRFGKKVGYFRYRIGERNV